MKGAPIGKFHFKSSVFTFEIKEPLSVHFRQNSQRTNQVAALAYTVGLSIVQLEKQW